MDQCSSLTKQVAQDLHLSSDGSDSKNPEETNKNTPAARNSQPSTGTAQTESGAKLLVTPPTDPTTPIPGCDPGWGQFPHQVLLWHYDQAETGLQIDDRRIPTGMPVGMPGC